MRFSTTLFFALASIAVAKAGDFVSNGIHYNILSATDKTVAVTSNPDAKYSGDITIPATVSLNGKELAVIAISNSSFKDCKDLTSVKLGANIEEIGVQAFSCCTGLKEISLEGKVKVIGNEAFEYCSGLLKLEIPSNVEEIKSSAFNNCANIAELTIHNGVKKIGLYSFSRCASLTEVVIPNSVEEIGIGSFDYCEKLKVVKFEDGDKILTLEFSYPWSNKNLDYFYLGRNTVTRILGWGAITAKEITIGSQVKSFSWTECINLEKMTLLCTTPPTCKNFTETQYAKLNVVVPKGTLDAYKAAEPWCNFWNIQESTSSDINQLEVDSDEIAGVYTLDGKRTSISDKGVLIVKMKSGKTMKVVK